MGERVGGGCWGGRAGGVGWVGGREGVLPTWCSSSHPGTIPPPTLLALHSSPSPRPPFHPCTFSGSPPFALTFPHPSFLSTPLTPPTLPPFLYSGQGWAAISGADLS
ncbi:unnamed protein product [Closterium sp. NIES-54]